MKRNTALTAFILVTGALVLALSSCSGVIGGDNSVRISVDELSGSRSSRYISTNADSGYVVVMQKNRIYSLNNFSDRAYHALKEGYVHISNLPVGDFIFGIVLTDNMGTDDYDDDDVYGLAIKEVKIKKGFNDVVIDVGPGIDTFEIGGEDFSDFLLPDGFGVSFATDTIILDTDNMGSMSLTYNDGVDDAAGTPIVDPPGGVFTSDPAVIGKSYSLTIIRK